MSHRSICMQYGLDRIILLAYRRSRNHIYRLMKFTRTINKSTIYNTEFKKKLYKVVKDNHQMVYYCEENLGVELHSLGEIPAGDARLGSAFELFNQFLNRLFTIGLTIIFDLMMSMYDMAELVRLPWHSKRLHCS